MYRYGAARPRPLPRALAAVARGDRLGRSGDRRRGDPVLRGAAAAARRDGVGASPQLDRRRELPPAVRRAARASGSTRIPSSRRRGGRAQARDERPPGLRREERAGARRARRRAEDRRLALRRLPRALRRGQGAPRRLRRSRTSLDPALVRGLDYYTRTTFEFVGPEENVNSTICGRRPLRRPRRGGRRAGDARASASAPASSGCMLAIEREGATAEAPRARHLRRLRGAGAARPASSRRSPRGGRRAASVDTDYAGRSMKGQLTQAQRLGAETVVVARSRRDVRGAAARGGGPRRDRPRGDLGGLARRHVRRAARRRRGPPRHGRRLGRHAPRPRRARLRRPPRPHGQDPARPQPGALAAAARPRTSSATSSSLQADGRGRRARRRRREPEPRRPARSRSRSTSCGSSRARRRCRSSSTRRTSTRTLRLRYRWLDMRTERMQRNLRLNHTAIAGDPPRRWTSSASSTCGRRA